MTLCEITKSAPMDDDFASFMGEIGELEAAGAAAAAAPAAAAAVPDASDEVPLSFLAAAVPVAAVKKPSATTIAKPAARVPAVRPGDVARHVIECQITQETRVQSALDDAASTGPGRRCSPRHRVPINPRDEGLTCVG